MGTLVPMISVQQSAHEKAPRRGGVVTLGLMEAIPLYRRRNVARSTSVRKAVALDAIACADDDASGV